MSVRRFASQAFALLLVPLTAAGAPPVASAAVPAHAPAAAANPRPATIPALREWVGGTGTYQFAETSRIVRNSAHDAALAGTSQTFADDLKALTGYTVTQVTGTPDTVAPGDIFLSLGADDAALGTEGYALSVTDRVAVTARADAGAFYGTRTILQLLKQDRAVPQGTARDWPDAAERGLMVDNGRKYFTPDWLRRHVKDLAYLKLNYLHLHLSDNLGFRIESTRHPEYVSAEHLTKAEVADLITLAARYKVTVVPEFDAPGHLTTVLAEHPDLKLVSNTGQVNNGFIDLSKAGAYTLLKDIYDEYLPLFPAPYFHIGADEYVTNYSAYPQLLTYARAHYGANANAKDTYLGFINWANDIVRAAGKTTRAWNDGIGGGSAVTVNPNVHIEFWYNHGLPAQQHVDNGHTISNESWDPTYYVLRSAGVVPADSEWGYETWTPNTFQGNQTLDDASRSKNLGSRIHVWCDSPQKRTEAQIAAGIRDPLRMLAQQLWGSPKLVPTWEQFQTVVGVVGRNPAWPAATGPGNLAYDRPVTASSTEHADFPAANAVDGDYGTRWSSAHADTEHITVDLGATRQISRVKLSWETAYGSGYRIQTSSDGTTWTDVYTTTTGDGVIDDITGLTGSGRYLRVQGTARATQWGFSLYEIEAFS